MYIKPYSGRLLFAGIFICIIYWVGMLGVATHNLYILRLTPVNMLVSLLVLNFGYAPSTKLYVLQLAVFVVGYFLEVFGVSTGWVFGDYRYMHNLGPMVFKTPLIMGVNWVVTVFCCAGIASCMPFQKDLAKAAAAAALMVFMDAFIEPISELAGFWAWRLGSAPWQNYVAWFVIGLAIQYSLAKSKVRLNNHLAALLYILQLLFFTLAYIYL